jgi:hypothetical protein
MKMHYRVGSIFWLMIGGYVASYAYQLGLGHFRQPGPGFIFFLAALLLIILGAIDLAGTFVGKPKTDKEERPIWVGLQWQRVLLVLGGLLAYVYFFNVAGFLLSTFLLMVFLFKGVEPTKWWIAIVSSLITILISYGIFEVWLSVPFPKGFLGF